MKTLIVLLCIGLTTGAVAGIEYGCFSRSTPADTWSPASITLNSSESIVFLNAWDRSSDSIELASVHAVNVTGYEVSAWVIKYYQNNFIYPESYRTISGPCTISMPTEGYSIQVRYKIIRAIDDVNTSPMNIISLPDDNNGDVDLLVETSTDLEHWTPVFSGSAGTSNSAAFFRTRLIQN